MTYEFQIETLQGKVKRVETSKGSFAEFYLPAIQSDEQLRLRVKDDNGETVTVILFKR